ncbi:hypothetical protein VHUM_03016 [Vanrija humicola]|uniref:Amino acid permease/ SLC12A domain-containing protein n=1 Tax=Vanrija humicola TaxID=5417 RepID=A0A7D8V195_VANHU|nr:hypothetical protein VHUM_03016 [Vanrija humicola]
MIAIGGVIGPGWFYSVGTGFTYGGPGGVILGFGVVGIFLYVVMQSLGELAAFISVTGSFTDYTARFMDPALAFALGWVYVFLWGGFLINEYYTLGLLCTYWPSKLPWVGFVVLGWVFFYAFGCIGVRGYGEAEFLLTWLKLLFIVSFFLCSVLITTGAIGNRGPVGFRYWRDPGAFSDGVKGVFKCFALAAVYYAGAEMIGLTAGEAKNPARDIPRAVRLVFIRIFVVYVGSLFFMVRNISGLAHTPVPRRGVERPQAIQRHADASRVAIHRCLHQRRPDAGRQRAERVHRALPATPQLTPHASCRPSSRPSTARCTSPRGASCPCRRRGTRPRSSCAPTAGARRTSRWRSATRSACSRSSTSATARSSCTTGS